MSTTLPSRPPRPVLLDERYELGPLLGRGGMSDVYRARDRHTGHDVAVKIFRPGVDLMDAGHRRRREVQLVVSLSHPGLVRVLDADDGEPTGDGPAYLVVELVEGQTLGRLIRQEPLTEPAVARLGADLCSALAYVHARGIVHRDVKPANVLMAADPGRPGGWSPKLTDFGIARLVDSTRMTVEGFTVGTANYLSPEQVTGDRVGVASDVYSLGLVLIEALTGELAFPGHGVEAAIARLHRDPEIPASPRLADLLAAMTARDPGRRPSAAAAQRAFERILDARAGRRHFAPSALRSIMVANPRRRAGAALGLVGGLAAATVATVLIVSPESSPSVSQPIPARPATGSTSPVAGHSSPVTSPVVRPSTPSTVRPVTLKDQARQTTVAHLTTRPKPNPAPKAKAHKPGRSGHGKRH